MLALGQGLYQFGSRVVHMVKCLIIRQKIKVMDCERKLIYLSWIKIDDQIYGQTGVANLNN